MTFWRSLGLAALIVLTLASLAPILSLIAASSIASAYGCQLDEGSVHPCLVHGVDIGETLNTAAVLGWLMFVTWPGVLASIVLWIVVLIRALRRRRRAAITSRASL